MNQTTSGGASAAAAGDAIAELLDGAQRFAQRVFSHRVALEAILLATAQQPQRRETFFFVATFVSNASQVLERQGVGSADTENLSREFSVHLEKAHELFRAIVHDTGDDVKQRLSAEYLSLSHDSLANLLALFREIAWIKSYQIHHKGSAA